MYISLFKSFIIYLISKFSNQPRFCFDNFKFYSPHDQQESDIFKFKLGVTDEIRQHRLA